MSSFNAPLHKNSNSQHQTLYHKRAMTIHQHCRNQPPPLPSPKVTVTLRLTVSQSVCLGVKPKSGTFDQSFFFPQSYCLVFLGCPLWREVGSVMCQRMSSGTSHNLLTLDVIFFSTVPPHWSTLSGSHQVVKVQHHFCMYCLRYSPSRTFSESSICWYL
jgi:hypothetical protein